MAKSKETPVIVKALNIVAYICFFAFVLGALMSLFSMFIKDAQTLVFLTFTLYFGSACLFLFGFYYIVKAACIYIEKEVEG